jgi:hypothetical protein
MTILDTFTILFKSNADDLKKGAKEAEKAVKELEDRTKGAGEQAEKLGSNFVKIVESGAAALGASLSLGAIKTGVLNAADFNRQLSIMAGNTGKNAQELKALSFAFKQLGGDAQDALGLFSTVSGVAISNNQPIPSLDAFIRRVREGVKMYRGNRSAELAYLEANGFNTPAQQRIGLMSDEEYEKVSKQSHERAELTKREAEVADEYAQSWSKVQDQFDALYTIVGSDVLPVVKALNETIAGFLDHLKSNKAEMYGFFAAMAVGATAASKAVASLALSAARAGLAGTAGTAGAGAAAAGVLGTLWKGAKAAASRFALYEFITEGYPAIAKYSFEGGRWLGDKLTGKPSRAASFAQSKSAMDFWTSQGYSREQAAVIVANETAESGGNASTHHMDSNGRMSYGLFQWNTPSRIQRILKNTGIDVRTASAEDQRKAAAWELEHTGIAAKLKRAGSIAEASDVFVHDFENPANWQSQSLKRAQTAMGIASSFPLNSAASTTNSATANVKIDQVVVHTQATDAHGVAQGITKELGWQMNMALSLLDNSWAR